METRPYRKLYWCISWDQVRVEQLGVAGPQRTAVFDATDTDFAATIVVADIAARAAVMSTAADAAVPAATTIAANVTALDTS